MKTSTDFIQLMKTDKGFPQGMLAAKQEDVAALLSATGDDFPVDELSRPLPNVKTHILAGKSGQKDPPPFRIIL